MLKQIRRGKWAVYDLVGRCIVITTNRQIAQNTLNQCLSATPT